MLNILSVSKICQKYVYFKKIAHSDYFKFRLQIHYFVTSYFFTIFNQKKFNKYN